MSHHRTETPRTITPGYVPFRLSIMASVIAIFLFWIFPPIWALVLLLVILAAIRPAFTLYVGPFKAQMMIDSLSRDKPVRCLRRGLNWIAPGETRGDLLDLQTDITEVRKDETYTTKIGQVVAKYMFSLTPDPRSDKALVRYASYKIDAIKTAARSLFSMLLSDYYRDKKTDEEILNKEAINVLVFNKDHPLIKAFEAEHGVIAEEKRLEDVDYDAATQAARDAVAKGESFAIVVAALVKGGTERSKAENIARQLMQLPGFTENLVQLNVSGLDKLEHFSMTGGIIGGKK